MHSYPYEDIPIALVLDRPCSPIRSIAPATAHTSKRLKYQCGIEHNDCSSAKRITNPFLNIDSISPSLMVESSRNLPPEQITNNDVLWLSTPLAPNVNQLSPPHLSYIKIGTCTFSSNPPDTELSSIGIASSIRDSQLPDTQVHPFNYGFTSKNSPSSDTHVGHPSTHTFLTDSQLPDTQIGPCLSIIAPETASKTSDFEPSISNDRTRYKERANLHFPEKPPSQAFNLGGPNEKGSKSESFTVKPSSNRLSLRERKRVVVSSNRPHLLTEAMRQWVVKTQHLLDPFREDNDCWFHPSPPPGHLSTGGVLRAYGKLQKTFIWQDMNGKHLIALNYGIVSKLVNHKMTKHQKDGFISKQWHLSHLCGNWTCLNPTHTTVESGNINISRNNCFSHRCGCLHTPACMKDRKVALDAHGMLVNHNVTATTNATSVSASQLDERSYRSFGDNEASPIWDDLPTG